MSHVLVVLLSLFDNGGLKSLNACELMMVLMAAARGLAIFKSLPQVRDDILKPLARRTPQFISIIVLAQSEQSLMIGLMGDTNEILRESVVEKAIGDPEVIFFMNDLESVSLHGFSSFVISLGMV